MDGNPRRIGFISTRFSGTDGVSLETRKWATLFEQVHCPSYYCAGELDVDLRGMQIPEMHFVHETIKWIHDQAFGKDIPESSLYETIEQTAWQLETELEHFITAFQIDLLVVENALAIPMNIPLGVAISRFLKRTGFPAIGHHHDFYWERERFLVNCVQEYLDEHFPPDLPNLKHVVISTPAQQSLQERRGIESVVIPNIFDFSQATPGINTFNLDLREQLGLSEDHLIILQPTRVVRRKGIELSTELVRRLMAPEVRAMLWHKKPVLLITHHAGDEGLDYLTELHEIAMRSGVELMYAATRFHTKPTIRGLQKIYSLWDAYIHADFVSYPSRYEGFGNALLESIYFRLPIMVNRYNVYVTDIAPKGFDLIEIDNEITDETVEAVIQAIMDPVRRRRMVMYNYELANHYFSYEAVLPLLKQLVDAF